MNRQKADTPSKKTHLRDWWIGGIGVLIFSLSLSVLLLIFVYKWVNPPITWLMVERNFWNEKTQNTPLKNSWVSIDKISPNMVLAVVAAEDNLFLSHNGFDFNSIKQAREESRKGIRTRGASTISMQVAKNVFLWHGRTMLRKSIEAGFTILIELFWSKKRIMEVYLNIIELGPAVYGVEQASLLYFSKKPADLTRNEAALLSTALPSPLKRNPSKPSVYMLSYQQSILKSMARIGVVNLNKPKNFETNTKKSKSPQS